ncbi:MAG: GIY-YIG nuclease family protein [Candidatus Omnitrophica bacterium]|nr:GIY-YIG nuclease family protein [Candidatus Omnitrophota bacterium]
MFYRYVLQNRHNEELYYGYTNNLDRRLSEHNNDGRTWKLVYYEAYLAEEDARARERKLKHYGQSRTHLKRRIKASLLL